MDNKICLIIISRQFLFKNGLSCILAGEPDIQIMDSGDRNNGIERTLENASPDIVIIDYDNEPELCLDIAKRIKQHLPHIGIIIFSSKTNDDALFAILSSRASAYLSKEASAAEIIKTIKIVADGGYPINESLHTNPRVAEHVLKKFQELEGASEIKRHTASLTERESEVLQYIADGYLNSQIAATLEVSERTIKNNIRSILRKLDTNARTEALVIGVQQGIIAID